MSKNFCIMKYKIISQQCEAFISFLYLIFQNVLLKILMNTVACGG